MTASSQFATALKKQAQAPKPTRAEITLTKTGSLEKIADRKVVNIIIKNGCAFIPNVVLVNDWNKILMTSPIYKFPLSVDRLIPTVDSFLHQQIPTVTHEEGMQIMALSDLNKHPLLLKTGCKNWEDLYANAAIYSIRTNEYKSKLIGNDKNRVKWTLTFPRHTSNLYPSLNFPSSTPIEELVWIILEDVKKYRQML